MTQPSPSPNTSRRERRGLASPLLSVPALLLVAALFLAPLAVLIVYSFWPTNDLGQVVHDASLSNYTQFFDSSRYASSLLKTFALVGGASLLAVVLTFPFAYFVATKVPPRWRTWWILLAVMPFWTSYLIRVFAWLNVFGDSGVAVKAWTGLGLGHAPGAFGLGTPAIVVTFVYLLFPFTFLTAYVALERSDPTLREASADLGARPWQVLGRVILPLAGTGLLSGFGFAFISMMGDYVTPQLIGGTDGALFANLLVNQFGASGQWGFGAVLALVMMVCVLLLLLLMRQALKAQSSGEFTRRYAPSRAPLLRVYSVAFLLFLYLPIFLVVLFAFNDAPYVGFPITGLTTRWFSQVFHNQDAIDAFSTSLQVAGLAVAAAVALAVPAAVQLSRAKGALRNASVALLSLPLLVPPVVLGLGIIIGLKALAVERSFWVIVAGHTLLVLPVVMLVVMARLEGLDRNQELAAMDLGATPARALWSVTIPQALPAIVAGAMLGFALSLDEFILTFLVTGTTTTLPLFVYGSLRFQVDPSLTAIATLVLAGSFLLALLAVVVNNSARGLRGRRAGSDDQSVLDLVPA